MPGGRGEPEGRGVPGGRGEPEGRGVPGSRGVPEGRGTRSGDVRESEMYGNPGLCDGRVGRGPTGTGAEFPTPE